MFTSRSASSRWSPSGFDFEGSSVYKIKNKIIKMKKWHGGLDEMRQGYLIFDFFRRQASK